MEVEQLLPDVFRAGTLLLLVLKVQQHVNLQRYNKSCSLLYIPRQQKKSLTSHHINQSHTLSQVLKGCKKQISTTLLSICTNLM